MNLISFDKSFYNTGYICYADPRFNYQYKGFCSIVCGIIDMAMEHYIENNNFNVKVGEPQTLELFDNISLKTNNQTFAFSDYDVGPWWLEKFFSNKIYQNEYNAHTPANIDNLKIKNKVYNNILRVKEEYLQKFKTKEKELGIDENTLGIQIRGTDKKQELPEIKIESIIKLIEQTKIEKIFVSTDDKNYLDPLLDRYGNRIIYDKSITISCDSQSLHHNCSNRSQINEEVLSSVYLLSKCNYFLYSFSNVSLLALIMGVNNFKFIDYLNK
jgi:hypothetical protein